MKWKVFFLALALPVLQLGCGAEGDGAEGSVTVEAAAVDTNALLYECGPMCVGQVVDCRLSPTCYECGNGKGSKCCWDSLGTCKVIR